MARDWAQCVGQKYGNWTILEVMPVEHYTRGAYKGKIKPRKVKAVCECGNVVIQQFHDLSKFKTKSCKKCMYRQGAVGGKKPDENNTYIVEALKAKFKCPYPREECLRSGLAHICCRECDKFVRCGWACENNPRKCGAKQRKVYNDGNY